MTDLALVETIESETDDQKLDRVRKSVIYQQMTVAEAEETLRDWLSSLEDHGSDH